MYMIKSTDTERDFDNETEHGCLQFRRHKEAAVILQSEKDTVVKVEKRNYPVLESPRALYVPARPAR